MRETTIIVPTSRMARSEPELVNALSYQLVSFFFIVLLGFSGFYKHFPFLRCSGFFLCSYLCYLVSYAGRLVSSLSPISPLDQRVKSLQYPIDSQLFLLSLPNRTQQQFRWVTPHYPRLSSTTMEESASPPMASTHLPFLQGDYTSPRRPIGLFLSKYTFPFGPINVRIRPMPSSLWISQHLITINNSAIMIFFYCRFNVLLGGHTLPSIMWISTKIQSFILIVIEIEVTMM